MLKIEKSDSFKQNVSDLKRELASVDVESIVDNVENQLDEMIQDSKYLKTLSRTNEFTYFDSASNNLFLIRCRISDKNSVITLNNLNIITERKSNIAFILSVIASFITFIPLFYFLHQFKIFGTFSLGNFKGIFFEDYNWFYCLIFVYYTISSLINVCYNYRYCRVVRKLRMKSEFDQLMYFLENLKHGTRSDWLSLNQFFYAFLQLGFTSAYFVISSELSFKIVLVLMLLFSIWFLVYSFFRALGLSTTGASFLLFLVFITGLLVPEMWLGISLVFTLFSNVFSEDIWKLTDFTKPPIIKDLASKYNRYQIEKRSFRVKMKISIYAFTLYIFLYLTKDINLFNHVPILNESDRNTIDSLLGIFFRGIERIGLSLCILIVYSVIKYNIEKNGLFSLENLKKGCVDRIYDYLYSEIKEPVPIVKQEISCYLQELANISPKIAIKNTEELPEEAIYTWLIDMGTLKATVSFSEDTSKLVKFVVRYPSGEYYDCRTTLKILKSGS